MSEVYVSVSEADMAVGGGDNNCGCCGFVGEFEMS